MKTFIVGIDEAGRGPLAGPVYVGAVIVPRGFNWKSVKGVRDSKKLSPGAREEWYRKLRGLREAGKLDFAAASSPAGTIDKRGIVPAVSAALEKCLKNLGANPRACKVLLDGGLRAPDAFRMQKTIIRGDETEPIISVASIVAKFRRDELMKRLARRFPEYGFDAHKGYGTTAHQASIKKHGLSKLHRKTFCTRFIKSKIKYQNAK